MMRYALAVAATLLLAGCGQSGNGGSITGGSTTQTTTSGEVLLPADPGGSSCSIYNSTQTTMVQFTSSQYQMQPECTGLIRANATEGELWTESTTQARPTAVRPSAR